MSLPTNIDKNISGVCKKYVKSNILTSNLKSSRVSCAECHLCYVLAAELYINKVPCQLGYCLRRQLARFWNRA